MRALLRVVCKFGATVRKNEEDSRQKKVWQMVGEPEANATNRRKSVNSPVGRELIGKTQGPPVGSWPPVGLRLTEYKK